MQNIASQTRTYSWDVLYKKRTNKNETGNTGFSSNHPHCMLDISDTSGDHTRALLWLCWDSETVGNGFMNRASHVALRQGSCPASWGLGFRSQPCTHNSNTWKRRLLYWEASTYLLLYAAFSVYYPFSHFFWSSVSWWSPGWIITLNPPASAFGVLDYRCVTPGPGLFDWPALWGEC